jgi:tripartite-type tricarboxylate transporter receptor subunit TctC
MKRRDLMALGLATPFFGTALAQDGAYPKRLVRLIAFGEPGGPLDILGRVFAERLAKRWNQTVIVETKPGAGGMIAADFVAKAPADGHTLLFTITHTQMVLPHLQKVPYDSIQDFQPLTPVGAGGPVLMVRADTPVNNVKEFVAWAKTKGRITCGSWGQGTAAHLYTELLAKQNGVNIEHVPYKGQAQSHIDLFGGVLDAAWANPATAKGHLQDDKSGKPKVRVLAIAGTQRVAALPDVPTFVEQGFKGGFETESWFGFLAPAKTPRPVVDQIVGALHEIAKTDEVRQRLIDLGLTPVAQTPEQFAQSQKKEMPQWEALIRAAGLRAN